MNLFRQIAICAFEVAGIAAILMVFIGWWVALP